MSDNFFFQRGKLLFDEKDQNCILTETQRSKTLEHSIFERSKSVLIFENKISQKTEKTEENES